MNVAIYANARACTEASPGVAEDTSKVLSGSTDETARLTEQSNESHPRTPPVLPSPRPSAVGASCSGGCSLYPFCPGDCLYPRAACLA